MPGLLYNGKQMKAVLSTMLQSVSEWSYDEYESDLLKRPEEEAMLSRLLSQYVFPVCPYMFPVNVKELLRKGLGDTYM